MILYDNTLVYAHTHQYRHLEEGLLTYMYDSSVTDHYYLLTDNVGSVVHVVNVGATISMAKGRIAVFGRPRCIRHRTCPMPIAWPFPRAMWAVTAAAAAGIVCAPFPNRCILEASYANRSFMVA